MYFQFYEIALGGYFRAKVKCVDSSGHQLSTLDSENSIRRYHGPL